MSEALRCVLIHGREIGNLWTMVEPLIQAAADAGLGDYDVEHIKRVLNEEAAVLLCAIDRDGMIHGAMVLHFIEQPDGRVIGHIAALGGHDFDKLHPLLPEIEDAARRGGAAAIRLQGRIGWSKILKDYTVRAVVMEKELGDGRLQDPTTH